MEPFRRFAGFPMLYRIDRELEIKCVWFTDLRYVVAFITSPLRYGMCREDGIVPAEAFHARRTLALHADTRVEENAP